jgi:hypothetical protein
MAAQHRNFCNKALDWHIRWDRAGPGFRAVIRCPCSGVRRTSRKLHQRCADAETEAKAMWARHLEQPPGIARGRKRAA